VLTLKEKGHAKIILAIAALMRSELLNCTATFACSSKKHGYKPNGGIGQEYNLVEVVIWKHKDGHLMVEHCLAASDWFITFFIRPEDYLRPVRKRNQAIRSRTPSAIGR
jgi:hypothetical protein